MTFPRVTQILSAYSQYGNVPTKILEGAAARGSAVHNLCAGVAKGNWIPDSMIAQELQGYVSSFRKWADAQVEKFLVVEKRYADENLHYTGQIDLLIQGSDKKIYLVDLKTSSKPQKTYPIQMAAYENLLKNEQIKIDGAILVYLDKEGDFPDVNLLEDMTDQFHIFLCALECWNYFNKSKRNARRNHNDVSRNQPNTTRDDKANT